MARLSPKKTDVLKPSNQIRVSWRQEKQSLPTSGESLELGLRANERRNRFTQDVVGVCMQLIKGVPIPALLLTITGKIISVNSGGRVLLRGLDRQRPWTHVEHIWKELGWPSVPFQNWDWQGRRLSVWDCPLGPSPNRPEAIVRYLMAGQQPLDQQAQQQDLARIGQEILRVAHDIRNPLSSLECVAALLGREDYSTGERAQLAGHLMQTIRALDVLVSNLLRFSRSYQVECQFIHGRKFFDEVELLALHPLQAKRITIHRSLDEEIEGFCGEEDLLKQAVLNVLLNAIQASPDEGRIEISCQRLGQQDSDELPGHHGSAVQIRVRDFGCGIPRSDIENIFHPFFSNRKGGTGLGLPIVKRIMDAHHGLIKVHSEQGQGTTVSLVLPQ